MPKTVKDYMDLPYTIELSFNSIDGWFAKVKELRGCMTQADTIEELWPAIRESMELWLEVALEDGDPIPLPEK